MRLVAGPRGQGFVDSSAEEVVFERVRMVHLATAHSLESRLLGKDYPVSSLEE